MDLSNLDVVKNASGNRMTLLNPMDNTPLIDSETNEPVTIQLLSADSPEYTSMRHKLQNGKLKRLIPGKRITVSSEEIDLQALDLLIAATKDWKGIEVDGKALNCTPDNARMVYTRFRWIRDQADEFINERSNFLGN